MKIKEPKPDQKYCLNISENETETIVPVFDSGNFSLFQIFYDTDLENI